MCSETKGIQEFNGLRLHIVVSDENICPLWFLDENKLSSDGTLTLSSLLLIPENTHAYTQKRREMHVVKRQCVLSTVGTILLAIAIIFAIFWFDIFISVLAKVCTFNCLVITCESIDR